MRSTPDCDNQTVTRLELGCDLIDQIRKDAGAFLATSAAGNTSTNGIGADGNQFCFHAVFPEHLFHLVERRIGTSFFVGTSVD